MADDTQNMINALSASDQAAMMPETYVNPLVQKKLQDFVNVLSGPGQVYNNPQPTVSTDLIPQAVGMAGQFGMMGVPMAESDALGMAGGKLRPYTYHATDEARRAAKAASTRLSTDRKQQGILSPYERQKALDTQKDIANKVEDATAPSWGETQEIDGLLNKGQLSDLETQRLSYLLNQRYK